MSALLEPLLTREQREEAQDNDRKAGITPAPQQSTGQDARVARLMVELAAERERADRLSEALDAAQRRIAQLGHDLLTLKGENARPQEGSEIARVICGDAYVLVEYDYTPAEEAVYDLNSPVCGPGHPEEIALLNVFINGAWCDIEDVRAALEDARLVERIAEARL